MYYVRLDQLLWYSTITLRNMYTAMHVAPIGHNLDSEPPVFTLTPYKLNVNTYCNPYKVSFVQC